MRTQHHLYDGVPASGSNFGEIRADPQLPGGARISHHHNAMLGAIAQRFRLVPVYKKMKQNLVAVAG
jgi:hypothetical protein